MVPLVSTKALLPEAASLLLDAFTVILILCRAINLAGKSVKVVVKGLGISGSYLLYRLSREPNIEVSGFDISKKYVKPCGDAVTLRPWIRDLLEELDVVRASVTKYTVKVEGKTVFEASLKEPYWYIVDKALLVEKLRVLAAKNGARIEYTRSHDKERYSCNGSRDCIIVDARGPFPHIKTTKYVVAIRYLARAGWDVSHALLDFYPRYGGLFWMFPANAREGIVNFGGGFLNRPVNYTEAFVKKYAKDLLDSYDLLDKRASPIAVFSPIRPLEKNAGKIRKLRIGESAGFIISTAGEGNRPGLESAEALYNAIIDGDSPKEIAQDYSRRVRTLVSEAKASRYALKLAIRLGGRFYDFSRSLPEEFWYTYLQGRITMGYLVKIVLRNPGLLRYLV